MQMPALLSLASRSAEHAAARQAVTARNVVNADTPGFKPSDLTPFSLDAPGLAPRVTRPGHLAGIGPAGRREITVDGPVDPNGNGVDLESEILRGVEAQSAHNKAITVYQASMSILRAAVGRR